jgi:SanA protein
MIRKIFMILFRLLLLIGGVTIFVLGASRLAAAVYAKPRIFSVEDTSVTRVAIVFGAGLHYDGTPTPVLRDRVSTAAQLYFAGKVQKLLLSGDNRFVDYNEPGAMREYALSLGVPEEDIVLDYAGRRTYDTCYRAKAIFKLDEAVLVTQDFHLPRALITCNLLGLPSTGVSADQRTYNSASLRYWQVRELFATLVAFWEAGVTHPLPVLGEPEPIFQQNSASSQ